MSFAVLDSFDCWVMQTGSEATEAVHQIAIDERRYLNSTANNRFAAFEMGIGPGHYNQIYWRSPVGSEPLSLHLLLHEEHGCAGTTDNTRFTELSVYSEPAAPSVGMNRIMAWNPACDHVPLPSSQAITLTLGTQIVSCNYLGFLVSTK